MDNARIAVFENETWAKLQIEMALDESSHEVVATAETRADALAVIERMAAGELAVDAVLLDGNLDSPQSDFSDARAIYDKLVWLTRQPAIIAISLDPLAEQGLPIPRERDITKNCLDSKLVAVLDDLPAPPED